MKKIRRIAFEYLNLIRAIAHGLHQYTNKPLQYHLQTKDLGVLMKKIIGLLSFFALMLLVACASQTMTATTYNDADVGQALIVRMGRIESARPIKISARPSGFGSMAGAAAGGVVGSEIGRGNGSVLGSIAGAVVGGVGGTLLEKDLNTVDGQELTVRLEDNSLISVAQEISKDTGPLSPGETVRVLSSSRGKTRVTR